MIMTEDIKIHQNHQAQIDNHQPEHAPIDKEEADEQVHGCERLRDHHNQEDHNGQRANIDQQNQFQVADHGLSMTTSDIEQQLKLLRHLLTIERHHNEQRRHNYVVLQKYLQRLQGDYLKQQQELADALELGHKIKAQKESQLEVVGETLREKDQLIEQLREKLANLDEPKLRQEIKESLEQQEKISKLEQDQLRHQIECLEQQLVHERVNNSQLLQQFQLKLDEQMKSHERELAETKIRFEAAQNELDKIINEPQNLLVKSLREDKFKLEGQLEELNLVLDESRNKYDNLKKRIESLSIEQEQIEQRNQAEMADLQAYNNEQRRLISELKLVLEDKHEIVQILQFNLQRSEKRVRNILGAMKAKELTYHEMVTQLELKHEQELEKNGNNLRSLERRLIDSENELDKKQNQLVRLQLEQENQLESIRTDRDERINRLTIEKSRLSKELQTAELKLAKEVEQSSFKTKQVDYLQKEVKQFKEESKRLSIELTKCEAKLYAKQQELNQVVRQSNLNQADNNNDSMQQISTELDEARRNSSRLERNVDELKKANEKLGIKLKFAESNLSKLTAAINREHNKMVLEYEKKLEQIKVEQSVFDKNKFRYKRYGYKLKKYCEHLRRVHQHFCNPSVCGYILGPLRAPAATNFGPDSKPEKLSFDKRSLLESTDDENEYDVIEYASDCGCETDAKTDIGGNKKITTRGCRLNRHNYCVIDCDVEKQDGNNKSQAFPLKRLLNTRK